MSAEELLIFVDGALAALSVVAVLFFVRYWRSSRDRFFGFFAAAFTAFAASWAALAFRPTVGEHDAYVYLLRLVAFLSIILAIIDKNRRPGAPP